MSVSYNRFYKWTFINDITQREEKGLVFCYSSVHMALSIGVLEGVQETAQICVTSFMNDPLVHKFQLSATARMPFKTLLQTALCCSGFGATHE